MNENELRNSIRSIEEKLKQSIDKYESKQKKFEDTQNELVATKEELRHLSKTLQESKSKIQQLEFENGSMTQQLLDIRNIEIDSANTRIINDRLFFENERLDRYIIHLIDSHSKQAIQPIVERSV